MQEHIELEVSLEKIMANIAQTIFMINNCKDNEKKKKLEVELNQLIDLEEKAYKGSREAVKAILNKEIKYE